MITVVVALQHSDETGGHGIEHAPAILAYGQDQAPHPMPYVTSAETAAWRLWDAIEAFVGHPAPADGYEVRIVPRTRASLPARPAQVDW